MPPGRATAYSHDNLGRITEERWYNAGDPVNPVHTITYRYDQHGNLATVSDSTAAYAFHYDDGETGTQLVLEG